LTAATVFSSAPLRNVTFGPITAPIALGGPTRLQFSNASAK
jgi:hypothetical protein